MKKHIFEDIILQNSLNFTREIMNVFEDLLKNGMNITELVAKIKELTDKLGREAIEAIIEELDKIIKEDKRRKEKWIVERKDKKRLTTVLGDIEYERTYYKSREDGRYTYLVDDALEIGRHERIEKGVKIKLVENAIEESYEKSSKKACPEELSKQTVLNAIREIGEVEVKREINEKKEVRVLYIEADEDHVPLQDGSSETPRLIYIHEGREEKNGRNVLKNVYYKAYVGEKAEDIWIDVANYIEDNYEVEKIEKIYIAGDGAPWIKEGLEWIVKSRFVLDRYHLNKYVLKATSKEPKYRDKIWRAINEGDKEGVKKIFGELIKVAKEEKEKEKIKEAKRYILNNWEGIKIYKEDEDVIGCSAEGHISHVFSARLSRNPLGWSREGLKLMAKLRVFSKNGGDLREVEWGKKKNINAGSYKLTKKQIKEAVRRVKTSTNEKINNITVLNIGKVTPIYRVLRALKYAQVI
ncbi:MAG: ISLre2 family transposase [Caldanaerobacter subterraneus]|nr:ISLre2 family transposase [Caldanaerobacter subterraneus]MBE3579122.1 ISLre2 family transposase [Caldanaerobacter subterraneus]MBE3579226.1 ISLre2 family transposase [Caldanaerobacter subterraneus]MBE3579302.1 ISLre2 family transposase [Caldanaerobacter subterraneus]